MGGGGAMRSAAKVAGVGLVNAGSALRGAPSVPYPAEHHAVSAARKPTRPASVISTSSNNPADGVVAAQRPSWELDEWEFAGGVEDDHNLFVTNKNSVESDHINRVVFGGAPTFQEATQATSELKDVLEKEYLKGHDNAGFGNAFPVYQEPSRAIVSNELKSPVVPKHALQAFKFLSESPAAQTVVASIASDPKVWNAVFENEAFAEYLHSQKTSAAPVNQNVNFSDLDGESKCSESSKLSEVSSESSESLDFEIDFLGMLKLKVTDMVDSLTGFFQNLFGVSEADKKTADADAHSNWASIEPTTLGASVFGLALMVITVVVLKRV